MRFMVMLKAAPETESGQLPPPEVFEAMNRYNEELAAAGVLVAAEGLAPTAQGVRIRFEGGQSTVTDGPFAETKELIAGYWMLEAASLEEATRWARRAPLDGGTVVEVRQVMHLEDFGDAIPEEVRETERRLRERIRERS